MSEVSDCCGSTCDLEDENCKGPVSVIGEEWTEDDYWWLHRCEFHEEGFNER